MVDEQDTIKKETSDPKPKESAAEENDAKKTVRLSTPSQMRANYVLDTMRDFLTDKLPDGMTADHETVEACAYLAREFLERAVDSSLKIAQHRGAHTLDAQDVALHMETAWDIKIPGFLRDAKLSEDGTRREALPETDSKLDEDVASAHMVTLKAKRVAEKDLEKKSGKRSSTKRTKRTTTTTTKTPSESVAKKSKKGGGGKKRGKRRRESATPS